MEQLNEITDGITTGVEIRKQRGLQIAALALIEKKDGCYLVPSQSNPRHTKYKVRITKTETSCNCPDHETRQCKCKHVYAVEFYIQRECRLYGDALITESLTITHTRQTCRQDWPNYNQAQMNEKRHFQELLSDLCKGIQEPAQDKPHRGRPRFPLSDAVFAIVFKIYSTQSGRRFTCDLFEARENGYINRAAHYNTAFKFIEKAELFPILVDLIEQTSLPLRSVESQFAVDSTGFAFCRFTRWFDIKYNKFCSEQQWVKAHICCGTKTNVITAVTIEGKDTGDATQLPALVESTAKRFDMKEVSADKGYSGLECHNAIDRVGAVPYIAFKDGATGGVGGLFEKMFHYFQFKREDFLAHYHRRSNVESTIHMVKSKFGDSVRSKSDVAARNEVLAKMLCHNICCLISAMYELGLEPMLGKVA